MITILIPITVGILLTPFATGIGFLASLGGLIRAGFFLTAAYAIIQLAAILTDSIPTP